MKNILIFTIFIISTISCKAQLVVDILDVQPDNNGIYYKDLNGLYNPYIGVWENTTGNLTFRLTLYKQEKVAFGYPTKYYTDMIYGNFLIIENAGEIDEIIVCNSNNYSAINHFPYNLIMGYVNSTECSGMFEDPCAIVPSSKSSLTGMFRLKLSNPNTAIWTLKHNDLYITSESFSIPQNVIMTKIN